MERKYKKKIAFLIALMMILASTDISFAGQQLITADLGSHAITPFWVGLNTVACTFNILSGGKSNPIVRGTTHAGAVDYVNVNVILKRFDGSDWDSIKTWNKDISISLNKFTFNEEYKVTKNHYYKFSATVKSYKNGVLLDTVSLDSKAILYQ